MYAFFYSGRNNIQEIEGLELLSRLDVLDLHGNKIRKISNINHLSQLRVLNLADNEIEVIENENGCEANIVWEYSLPEEYFGFASGNVQKLDNGNYLIVTVGNGGTALEVDSNNEAILRASRFNNTDVPIVQILEWGDNGKSTRKPSLELLRHADSKFIQSASIQALCAKMCLFIYL